MGAEHEGGRGVNLDYKHSSPSVNIQGLVRAQARRGPAPTEWASYESLKRYPRTFLAPCDDVHANT